MSRATALTHEQWIAEGESRFGRDRGNWRFVCPSCGHVASLQDWKDKGAPDGAIAYSCVGRYTPDLGGKIASRAFKRAGGPCNYAGGGLFALNPVEVVMDGKSTFVFAFAEVQP